MLGIVWARYLNNDKLHAWLRRKGITHQTSYPSEWYGVLSQNRAYAVLHLSGQRRIYGWLEEWPSAPDMGHFVMTYPEWLDVEEQSEPTGIDKVLIKATDVEFIEFMTQQSSEKAGQPNG